MKHYDIITIPDPVLKQTAHKIENITPDIKEQAQAMLDAMYDARGIGLAANQVAELNRMFVMDLDPASWVYDGEEKGGVLRIGSAYRSGEKEEEEQEAPSFAKVFINPEITWESEQRSVYEEGCLSIPKQYADVERPAKVKVKYINLAGEIVEEEAEGLVSHCIQHEIDHLNGVLFIDYLSSLKRNMIVRKIEKAKKSGGL
ncbi:MAG: peptide deformylase [Alphaproteobacteria bacterium]|nr:peptide deformylase [Alphaproteobacteria bacterium]MCD8520363.1 peptide deformylase [Alphaproteobacteria bacterium]MCD8526051.1 peptide deformylase [Alphaproteobacteria bacterium]MCD8571608.1 peptide deformylase [Alphaproteobacteria bacterium]